PCATRAKQIQAISILKFADYPGRRVCRTLAPVRLLGRHDMVGTSKGKDMNARELFLAGRWKQRWSLLCLTAVLSACSTAPHAPERQAVGAAASSMAPQ